MPTSADAPDPWNWSEDDLRRVGHAVVDLIAEHWAGLPEEPAFRPVPAELAARWAEAPLPEEGETPARILRAFAETIAPHPFGNGHPRFFAWVNSTPAPMGVFGAALAAAMNPSVAGGNHAATHVERQVLRWFRDIVGYPDAARGLLVSGGSTATLTALATALTVKAGFDVRAKGVAAAGVPLTVYASEEGHACIQKAVELLGLGHEQLRRVPVDAAYRMRPEALEARIRDDLRAGCRPLAVAASAGTVNTGAIDPLAEITAVCRRHDLWLHVDGAYGLPAILTEEAAGALAPVAEADSIAVDPHKWMYVPVDAGLVLVRDGERMRDAFALVPEYLRPDEGAPEVSTMPWFSEYGFEQTRPFRALKVWMALKHHGLRGYRHAIARNLRLAAHLARRVDDAPDLELLAPRGLSIVCFRYRPPGGSDGEAANALNRAVLADVQAGGEAFVTGTTLAGRFALRACIVNARAREADVDVLVDAVRAAGAARQA